MGEEITAADDAPNAQSGDESAQESHARLVRFGETFLLVISTGGFLIPGFFGHWYEWWVKWGFVQVFIIAVLIWVHGWMRQLGTRRTARLLTAVLFVFLEASEHLLYYFFPEMPVHVGIAQIYINDGSNRNLGMWIIGYRRFPIIAGKPIPPRIPETMRPVSAAIFIQLTNETGASLMVDSFNVEVKNKSGDWAAMTQPVVDLFNVIVRMRGPNQIDQVGFGVIFDFFSEISHKNIAPGETIQGWMFFDTPEKVDPAKIRFHMKDTTGKESVEPMELVTPLTTFLQERPTVYYPFSEDISKAFVLPPGD